MAGCWAVKRYDNMWSFAFSITFPIIVVITLILLIICLFKRKKVGLLYTFALILFFFCFNSFYQINSSDSKDGIHSLAILTYNTNNFESRKDEQKILNFVKDKNADVVFFQEFSSINYKYLIDDYPYMFKSNIITPFKSVLAVFSKYPIKSSGVIEFSESKNNSIYADILVNDELIRFYNLHLESFGLGLPSNDKNEPYLKHLFKKVTKTRSKQKEQVEIVLNHAQIFNGKTIIGGDFNSTQFSSTYSNLLKDGKDTFIEKGNGLGSTYSLKGYPLRLDYVLVDKNVDVLSHEIFELGYSDHEPVMVRLSL